MVSIKILQYYIVILYDGGPIRLCVCSFVDRNVVMRRILVFARVCLMPL